MINKKDVIRMRIPYPGISSTLAVSSHMYICMNNSGASYEYVKCQTLKPKMLGSRLLNHYVDEEADISRNPFQRTTRIDCDKTFTTDSVQYNDGLKTTSRTDICTELYNTIVKELNADGYTAIKLDENDLFKINSMITRL